MATYSLFSGRHELPENQGAICQAFDFDSKTVIKTELWDKALQDQSCRLYVTGLTPALTQFIAEYKERNTMAYSGISAGYPMGICMCPSITLLHYDNATGAYWEQKV